MSSDFTFRPGHPKTRGSSGGLGSIGIRTKTGGVDAHSLRTPAYLELPRIMRRAP